MKPHHDYALEQEQLAERATKDGDLELALWGWTLAVVGWRDAIATARGVERERFIQARELALRRLGEASDRLADSLARPPAPTQGSASA